MTTRESLFAGPNGANDATVSDTIRDLCHRLNEQVLTDKERSEYADEILRLHGLPQCRARVLAHGIPGYVIEQELDRYESARREDAERIDLLLGERDLYLNALRQIHEYICGCHRPGDIARCVAQPVVVFDVLRWEALSATQKALTCLGCGQREVVPHGGGFKCRACGAEEEGS